jgi:transposase
MTTELGGCPTKFTEKTKNKLLEAIRKGAPYAIACDYAGITYACFNQWQHKANDDHIPEFVAFFDELNAAKGETALKWLDFIDKAMLESWQAAAWKLERRYFKHFSNNAQAIEHEERLSQIEAKLKEKHNDKA